MTVQPAFPLRQTPERPDIRRWVRAALATGVVIVVGVGGRGQARPGLHGVGLVVGLSLLGLMLGAARLLSARPPRRTPGHGRLAIFAVLILCSATLVWVEPDGSGFLGGFVAASMAASQLPKRFAAAIGAVTVLALAAGSIGGGSRAAGSMVISEFGVIAFYNLGRYASRLRERTEQAERLLAELAETREAQTRAAALAERQRLAREVHDVLAHSLSGLLLQLEGARLLANHDAANPQLPDTIERAHSLAKSGLSEARRAIGTLRDEQLPGPERLPALVQEFQNDTGISCRVEVVDEARTIGADQRLTIYRVAQEALTNVRKHAHARRVDIRLDHRPTGVCLKIQDFGDAGEIAEPGNGYGLTGMRERAELLDGTLTAGPTETGFRVELWIPT